MMLKKVIYIGILLLSFNCYELMSENSVSNKIEAARKNDAPCTLGYEFENNLPLYYEQMRQENAPTLSLSEYVGEIESWRNAAHTKFMEMAGPFPPDCEFDAEVLMEEQRDGYVVKKVSLNLSSWERINMYLLIPDDSVPHPAVVLMHDHGAHFSIGKEKVVRPILTHSDSVVALDAATWVERCYGGRYVGDELAHLGYVVAAIDAPYFGERGAKSGSRYVEQQAIASNFLHLGYSWAGITLHDDLRTLEYVRSLPCVDDDRISAMGFSYGAFRAWTLAAASRSLAAVVSVCWLGNVRDLVVDGNNITRGQTAYTMYFPRLAQYLDFGDIAAISSPTPAMYIQGNDDVLFTRESVNCAFDVVRKAYSDVHERLSLVMAAGGHVFDVDRQKTAFDFLDKWGR